MTQNSLTVADSDVMALFDGAVERLAEELASLSARARAYRAAFASDAAHQEIQQNIERTILAYLALRCGCGRAATMPGRCCPVCADARALDGVGLR